MLGYLVWRTHLLTAVSIQICLIACFTARVVTEYFPAQLERSGGISFLKLTVNRYY